MSINKFTTLLDLSRQAKIITGETATFDGKIEVGIPFSGYPTGVDTGTTVSLGVVSSQNAIFSGNTGTTKFNVSSVSSPNYNVAFSAYTATTWTNPLFSGGTSGLTLPITTISADTQIVGPFWTLTQTGYTGDYIIGTQYTGYTITYSFNNVTSSLSGTSFSGFTTAQQENFSAGTLDYKGPLDYLQSVEDATIGGRLHTNKIAINNGASASTIGYILTQTSSDGEGEWLPNLSSGSTFTGNTSASCIGDIYVSKIHSCSPLEINPNDEGNVYIGSLSAITLDLINKRFGLGTATPQYLVDVVGTNTSLFYNSTSDGGNLTISGSTNIPRFGVLISSYLSKPSTAASFGIRAWNDTSFSNYGKVGDAFLRAGNETNGLNIINDAGTGTEDYIRFYAGINAGSTSHIHIGGTGSTKGYVGFGTENPTEKVDVNGKTKTISFQMTSGATNGYVLTSDGSGNATWQVSTGSSGAATTATTTTINFTGQTIYYNSTSPATGNITQNLSSASLGLIQKIYHNDTVEPTYPVGWVLMGDAIYFTSTLNIIYAEWAGGSRVEYWYVQEQ
jgi:hypothetical protein